MLSASQPSAARSVTHCFCKGYGPPAHWRMTSAGNFPARFGGAHVYGQLAKPKRAGKFPALVILQWAGGPPTLSILMVAYSTSVLPLSAGVRTAFAGTAFSVLILEAQKASKSEGRGAEGCKRSGATAAPSASPPPRPAPS